MTAEIDYYILRNIYPTCDQKVLNVFDKMDMEYQEKNAQVILNYYIRHKPAITKVQYVLDITCKKLRHFIDGIIKFANNSKINSADLELIDGLRSLCLKIQPHFKIVIESNKFIVNAIDKLHSFTQQIHNNSRLQDQEIGNPLFQEDDDVIMLKPCLSNIEEGISCLNKIIAESKNLEFITIINTINFNALHLFVEQTFYSSFQQKSSETNVSLPKQILYEVYTQGNIENALQQNEAEKSEADQSSIKQIASISQIVMYGWKLKKSANYYNKGLIMKFDMNDQQYVFDYGYRILGKTHNNYNDIIAKFDNMTQKYNLNHETIKIFNNLQILDVRDEKLLTQAIDAYRHGYVYETFGQCLNGIGINYQNQPLNSNAMQYLDSGFDEALLYGLNGHESNYNMVLY